MKQFIKTFMASQGAESIQWPDISSDLSEDNIAKEEERKDEVGWEDDDEATKDDDFEPYHDDLEDVFVLAQLSIGGLYYP